jgi:hypothetical protein
MRGVSARCKRGTINNYLRSQMPTLKRSREIHSATMMLKQVDDNTASISSLS